MKTILGMVVVFLLMLAIFGAMSDDFNSAYQDSGLSHVFGVTANTLVQDITGVDYTQ